MQTPDPSADERPAGAKSAYPTAMRDAEEWMLGSRSAWPIGVALSGGGIRSATFALGVFQAWARKGLLRHIGFLSTVSGGGYFGAFYGRLFRRSYIRSVDDVAWVLRHDGDDPPRHDHPPSPQLVGARGSVLNWLRENGRYLAPSGTADLLLMAAAQLRSLASINIVLALLPLAGFLALQAPEVLTPDALKDWFDWLGRLRSRLPGYDSYLQWSWFATLTLITTIAIAPLTWAYWLIGERRALALTLGVAAYLLFAPQLNAVLEQFGYPSTNRHLHLALSVVAWIAVATIVALAAAGWRYALALLHGSSSDELFGESAARNRLSLWSKAIVIAVLALAALSVVDTAARTVYGARFGAPQFQLAAAGWAAITAIAASARQIVRWFQGDGGLKRLGRVTNVLVGIAALIVIGTILVLIDVLAYGLVWEFTAIGPGGAAGGRTVANLVWWLVVVSALAAGFGWNMSFVNQSSHASLYSARLARTYLGASNPARWSEVSAPRSVIETVEGDDIPMDDYWPRPSIAGSRWRTQPAVYAKGAPLHIVNVTINETVSGRSHVQQRDRKGLGLAVGPAGLSASRHHHVLLPEEPKSMSFLDRVQEWVLQGQRGLQEGWVKIWDYSGRTRQSQPPAEDSADANAPAPSGNDHQPNVPIDALPPASSASKGEVAQSDTDQPVPPAPVQPPADDGKAGDRDAGSQRGFRIFEYGQPGNTLTEPFDGERLTLGEWVGISGAAFSTGMGSRTSLGLSLLTGLMNVRLGYWWRSGVKPESRQQVAGRLRLSRLAGVVFETVFKVQKYLLAELVARFPGVARPHWYLSDGGHFENLGGYELIRRRLPVIVIVDAEQDAGYQFQGLANLVRKARIDFGAHITFDDDRTLKTIRPHPGGDLQPADVAWSTAHYAVGRVRYDDEPATKPPRTVVYIKASLTGDEDVDLVQYARENTQFPHQSTVDQFFDESQWESYRRLGEHIGAEVPGELLTPPDGKVGFNSSRSPTSGRPAGPES